MIRTRDSSPTNSRSEQLQRMLLDEDVVKEYREQHLKLTADENTANASGTEGGPEAQDITEFSDMSKCLSLAVRSSSSPDSPVFFGHETTDGFYEMLFYDVLFVKNTVFPPLPDRRYKNPGTLYHSISLVAPPGEARMLRASDAMQNLFLCMGTASSTRQFADYSPRTWYTSDEHGDQHETYLTCQTLSSTADIRASRVPSKACAIPATFDTNGAMQRIVDASRGALCFTPDNLFRVCDLTVPANATKSAKFPSPDVVVSGQLVYVTFTVRGVFVKPPGARGPRVESAATYAFRPTLKSLIVLSKSGPMAMQRFSMLKSVRFAENEDVVQDREMLEQPTEQDISRDLKRLRIDL